MIQTTKRDYKEPNNTISANHKCRIENRSNNMTDISSPIARNADSTRKNKLPTEQMKSCFKKRSESDEPRELEMQATLCAHTNQITHTHTYICTHTCIYIYVYLRVCKLFKIIYIVYCRSKHTYVYVYHRNKSNFGLSTLKSHILSHTCWLCFRFQPRARLFQVKHR